VTIECAGGAGGVLSLWGQTCTELWGQFDNTPALWFSDFAGKAIVRGFGFSNDHPVKLGIDSTGDRTNGGIVSVWLDRVSIGNGGCTANVGAGPLVDIGGSEFWTKISDSSISGCPAMAFTIKSVSRTSGVSTITVDHAVTNDFVAGSNNYLIVRNISDQTFNGSYLIASASGTTITYSQPNNNNVSPVSGSNLGQVFPYGAAAIGVNAGAGAGEGYIYLDYVALNSGGVWMQGGYNGYGIIANHISYEGNFVTPDMSIFELFPSGNQQLPGVGRIDDVQIADNESPNCGVESFSISPAVVSSATICGQMTAIGGFFNITNTVSPLVQNIHGDIQGNYVGFGNWGRRNFPPTAVRFPNLAGASSTWSLSGVTKTDGKLAPDGTMGATRLNNTTGVKQIVTLATTGPLVPTVGDTYTGGVYVSVVSGGSAPAVADVSLGLNGSLCAGDYYNTFIAPNTFKSLDAQEVYFYGDGDWRWYAGRCKVARGVSDNQTVSVTLAAGEVLDVYAPLMSLVPTGTISDDEIAEMVNKSAPYSSAALAGDVSMLPGQRFLFDREATMSNCAAVGTGANPSLVACGSASAGQFSCATAATGGTCTVATTAVTANSEILVQESDTTLTGTRLSVTCNTSTTVIPTSRFLASSIAGTSFTINLGTVTTNPACFSYRIIN
jgi:hypothetical protein